MILGQVAEPTAADMRTARALFAHALSRSSDGSPQHAEYMSYIRDGGLDRTVGLATIAEAVAIGARLAVAEARRLDTARRLLADAYARLDRARGGAMVTRGCAPAIMRGAWDDGPLIEAIMLALAGTEERMIAR